MGNAQNIQMTLATKSKTRTYQVKNAHLSWGKFYGSHKNDELSPDKINEKTFKFGSTANVNACGRNDTSSGTEGTIDLYDGGVKCGQIYWDCPWRAGASNTVRAQEVSEDYSVEVGGYQTSGPEIGSVTITISMVA